VTLTTPVTLSSGVAYRITSDETAGGDQWMDAGTAVNAYTKIANINAAVVGDHGGSVYPNDYVYTGQYAYVPPTFYTTSGNVLPTVALVSPTSGATATAPASFVLTATASGNNGATISSVKFYNGSTLLATVTSSPYTYTWSNVTAGSYTITAVATDSKNNTNTSAAATVTVTSSTVTLTNFFSALYSGTRNNYTGSVGYLFTPTTNITVTALGRSVSGSMVNSHTVRIWQDSTETCVASATVTPTSSQPDGLGYMYVTLGTPVTLTSGTNYRITTDETAGGDDWMDLSYGGMTAHSSSATITGGVAGATCGAFPNDFIAAGTNYGYGVPTFYTGSNGTPPNCSLTSPANGASVVAPGSFTLTASASGNNGATISNVKFYQGTALLATVTSSPYTYTWTGVTSGTYNLTAVATDSNGNTTTSSVVTVSVNAAATVYYAANGTLGSPTGSMPVIDDGVGAPGGLYVGNMWPAGNYVQFSNVFGDIGGTGTISITYANGEAMTFVMVVTVNNGTPININLPPTGGWSTYATTSTSNITLAAGSTNIIKVASDNSDTCNPEFNAITVTAP
jgi:hypothetical protein